MLLSHFVRDVAGDTSFVSCGQGEGRRHSAAGQPGVTRTGRQQEHSAGSAAKGDCVLILPGVKKFGFGVGGSGGRGPLLCRGGKDFKGKWSAPAMFSIGGASVGLQVGGSTTDFVLLLMNPKVVNQVLNGKTKMGSDATAAAGPGATAAGAADVDILTYGRAKGVFAGVSLGGATVEPDNDANYRLYGKTVTATVSCEEPMSSHRAKASRWLRC